MPKISSKVEFCFFLHCFVGNNSSEESFNEDLRLSEVLYKNSVGKTPSSATPSSSSDNSSGVGGFFKDFFLAPRFCC